MLGKNNVSLRDKVLLLNPGGILLTKVASELREARKFAPIWAKVIEGPTEIETMEGRVLAGRGDFLCRGISHELWPQSEYVLLGKYQASDQWDDDGWQLFIPRPTLNSIDAVAIPHPFRIATDRGELLGKADDYLVRSRDDFHDLWIVDKIIFEETYRFIHKVPNGN